MGKVFTIPFTGSSQKIQPVYTIDNSAQEKSEAEEKARKEALARQRRGVESTINTSYNLPVKNCWENNHGKFCGTAD